MAKKKDTIFKKLEKKLPKRRPGEHSKPKGNKSGLTGKYKLETEKAPEIIL